MSIGKKFLQIILSIFFTTREVHLRHQRVPEVLHGHLEDGGQQEGSHNVCDQDKSVGDKGLMIVQ